MEYYSYSYLKVVGDWPKGQTDLAGWVAEGGTDGWELHPDYGQEEIIA